MDQSKHFAVLALASGSKTVSVGTYGSSRLPAVSNDSSTGVCPDLQTARCEKWYPSYFSSNSCQDFLGKVQRNSERTLLYCRMDEQGTSVLNVAFSLGLLSPKKCVGKRKKGWQKGVQCLLCFEGWDASAWKRYTKARTTESQVTGRSVRNNSLCTYVGIQGKVVGVWVQNLKAGDFFCKVLWNCLLKDLY